MPKFYNRPAHYKTTKVPKEKSTSFFLSERFLKLLKEVALFEGENLSIIIERSLHYAKNGDFKKANKIKKKKNIYAKKKHKQTNYKRKQKARHFKKCLFN